MQIPTGLATIPGYVDAVERENKIRNAAILNLNTRICGFEVRQMTLRDWVILDGINSPFMVGGLPDPDKRDIEMFLWVLSPRFTQHNGWRKHWFFYRAGKIPYGKAVVECARFVNEAFQDMPPTTEKKDKTWNPPHWSLAVSIADSICTNYHWTRSEVYNMPVKEVFQFLKIVQTKADASSGAKPMLWNPSDKIRWEGIRKIRAEREAAKRQAQQN